MAGHCMSTDDLFTREGGVVVRIREGSDSPDQVVFWTKCSFSNRTSRLEVGVQESEVRNPRSVVQGP